MNWKHFEFKPRNPEQFVGRLEFKKDITILEVIWSLGKTKTVTISEIWVCGQNNCCNLWHVQFGNKQTIRIYIILSSGQDIQSHLCRATRFELKKILTSLDIILSLVTTKQSHFVAFWVWGQKLLQFFVFWVRAKTTITIYVIWVQHKKSVTICIQLADWNLQKTLTRLEQLYRTRHSHLTV